jgi:hypothetical protein
VSGKKSDTLGLPKLALEAADALHKLWERRENFSVHTSFGLVVSEARKTELLLHGWAIDDDRDT